MMYSLYVPVNKVVEYYETVIILKLEDMTRSQSSSVADGGDDKENEDKPLPDNGEEAEGSWSFWMDEILSFVEYMDRTWIGRKDLSTAANKGQRFSRRKPLFPLDLWNQVDVEMSVDHGEEMVMSTNNSMESYNRTMRNILGAKPNLWKVIQSLIAEEADTRRLLVSHAIGQDLSANTGRMQNVKEKHDRILCLVKRFQDLSPGVYLRAMSAIIDHDK